MSCVVTKGLAWRGSAGEAQEVRPVRLCWELLAELLRLSHSTLRSSSRWTDSLGLTRCGGRNRLERLRFRVPPLRPSSVVRLLHCSCRGGRTCSDTVPWFPDTTDLLCVVLTHLSAFQPIRISLRTWRRNRIMQLQGISPSSTSSYLTAAQTWHRKLWKQGNKALPLSLGSGIQCSSSGLGLWKQVCAGLGGVYQQQGGEWRGFNCQTWSAPVWMLSTHTCSLCGATRFTRFCHHVGHFSPTWLVRQHERIISYCTSRHVIRNYLRHTEWLSIHSPVQPV